MLRTLLTTVLALTTVAAAQDAAKPAVPAAPTAPAAPAAPAEDKVVFVKLATSKGDIILELNETKAPLSVANFVQYVKDGHYDGTTFHRVIGSFMIQGGGFTQDMQQKSTDAPVENEAKNGLKNVRGAISMARTSNPQSATSQFFLVHKDSNFLDYPGQDGWGYCVFGKISKGLEVLDAIAAVETTNQGMHQNVPAEPVLIKSAKVSE